MTGNSWGQRLFRYRVLSDQSRTDREIISRLWDVLDDPHLNQALGLPQNSRITCSLTVQGCRPPHKKVPLVAHLIYFRLRWMAPGHKTGGRTKNTRTAADRAGRSPRRQLKPGMVLVRDYHGQRHTVTVAPDGFDWQCT